MSGALTVEWLKLRRSRVPLVATVLMSLFVPGLGLGFYSVAVSGGVGSLADKASALLIGEGWSGYMGMVAQITAVALFLGAGIVVAWSFGREHIEGTFPSLFALTVTRKAIARAKFVVLTAWMVALSLLLAVITLLLGVAIDVGPLQVELIGPGVLRLLATALAAAVLALPMGHVASIGRGYLPAIAVLGVIIATAQIAVLFGTGGWFPFAVPGLTAIAGADGAPELNAAQFALVPIVGAAGIWLTTRWWQKAEVV